MRFDEAQKFIFYSVLEGLYEDGVSTEDVERILMKREKEYHFHFNFSCPVCMGSIWAFESYRNRPEKLHSVKSGPRLLEMGWKRRFARTCIAMM